MKPYYEIEKKSTIAQNLIDTAHSSSDWIDYFNFKAKLVPPEVLFQDEFFKWLVKRYDFIAGILKLDPYTCYDWHTDTKRGVGINMLLTPHARSFCAFTPKKSEQVFKIEELSYKPMTYYLFNTQVNHTVYNFETTRYLLSIEFAKEKHELSFEDLLVDIRTHYEKNCTK
jgi:hypothetical protein